MSWKLTHTTDEAWLKRVYGEDTHHFPEDYWMIEHIDYSCHEKLHKEHAPNREYRIGVYAITTPNANKCWSCDAEIPEKQLFIRNLLELNI